MVSRYEPKDHIQHVEIGPRAEGILDQRDITVQSYRTTVPFDSTGLNSGLDRGWLTPAVRFGVFSRSGGADKSGCSVVLGLQDDLSIRAYDYDARRPLWYSWKDVVVETVSIRYHPDSEGLLCFTATGGGRRITPERLQEFNGAFLGIPKEAVTKRHFDLAKLRELCLGRFVDRLYMVRFSEPSGEEYRSIDHAMFQSRKYIDPDAERLQDLRSDGQVKIESFDSDVDVGSAELAQSVSVRFFIRGLSGALRLRFPKMFFKRELSGAQEEAEAFYRVVDETVRCILDADYYTQHQHSLDELDAELGMFPDMVDLGPFRDAFTRAEAREKFFLEVNVGAPWSEWQPHLRAIDELLPAVSVREHVLALTKDLARRNAVMAGRVLFECSRDAKLGRIGSLVAEAVGGELQSVAAEVRAHVQEGLLAWAISSERASWDVDPESGEIEAMNTVWRLNDLAFDTLPSVIWKVLGVVHDRIVGADGDVALALRQFNWCVEAARRLPAFHARIPAALRLIAEGRVPVSVADGAKVLKAPVQDVEELDAEVLSQFGLPLWPLLGVYRSDGKLLVENTGVGSALSVRVRSGGIALAGSVGAGGVDLAPGQMVALQGDISASAVELVFSKLGKEHRLTLAVGARSAADADGTVVTVVSAEMDRARLKSQLGYRASIDPEGMVVGSSPALLEVFEQIHHLNLLDGCPSVLLLGEPGVGKTHLAKLLHDSSRRAAKTFKVVNAGGGGGDLNIQRGEWIGYGKNHGLVGIDKNGRNGHVADAHGGTLFVDEFAALSLDLQVVFLSVLEGRSIEKVGGQSFVPDVRCIFATNADIAESLSKGLLRRDLIDRIDMKIRLPALRERRGDILLLVRHFAGSHGVTDRCLAALLRYSWPGNVREMGKQMAGALARQKSHGVSDLDICHLDLPSDVTAAVNVLQADECRRGLWQVADEIARAEGFAHGKGLQRRAGEIMGVGESQASKMYATYDLIAKQTC